LQAKNAGKDAGATPVVLARSVSAIEGAKSSTHAVSR